MPDNDQPPSDGSAASCEASSGRMSLLRLVAVGTVVVTLMGAALFVWLAWLLSHQPAPLRGNSGWWDWLEHVGGTELFDAARTTATILAIVGVGGAALVAYRRQDTAERAHDVAIKGQEIASAQYVLDSQKYQLDRDRHQLELDRRQDDSERDLRARFATVFEQLGSPNFAVRHAGAYALGSLADDWQKIGNDDERQVCIDLLCAQLRRARPTDELDEAAQDLEVRKTIVALIRSHRPVSRDNAHSWESCALDLSGADLSGFSFLDTDLRSSNLDDANLSGANFIRADLSDAMMTRANLSGADFSEANLTGARLFSVRTERRGEEDVWRNQAVFGRAILQGAQFTSAILPNAEFDEADLQDAILHNAKLEEASFKGANLFGARFIHSTLSKADFRTADLRGTNFAYADVHEAQFEDARHNAQTNWSRGAVPPDVAPIEQS